MKTRQHLAIRQESCHFSPLEAGKDVKDKIRMGDRP